MNVKSLPPKYLPLFAVAALMLVSSGALAQSFFDDFEDGSAVDGNPVTWVPFPGYNNGSFTVDNGDYLLVSNTASGPILATVPSISAADVSLRTQIRVAGNTYGTSLFARFKGGVSTYQGGIDTDGDVYIGWNDGSGMYHNLADVITSLQPNQQDVLLQFDVIGADLSLYAWPEGQPMPSQPTVHVSDTLISAAGTIGVLHAPSSPGSARFRFVETATESIPEPSTVFLTLIGLALMGRRWR